MAIDNQRFISARLASEQTNFIIRSIPKPRTLVEPEAAPVGVGEPLTPEAYEAEQEKAAALEPKLDGVKKKADPAVSAANELSARLLNMVNMLAGKELPSLESEVSAIRDEVSAVAATADGVQQALKARTNDIAGCTKLAKSVTANNQEKVDAVITGVDGEIDSIEATITSLEMTVKELEPRLAEIEEKVKEATKALPVNGGVVIESPFAQLSKVTLKEKPTDDTDWEVVTESKGVSPATTATNTLGELVYDLVYFFEAPSAKATQYSAWNDNVPGSPSQVQDQDHPDTSGAKKGLRLHLNCYSRPKIDLKISWKDAAGEDVMTVRYRLNTTGLTFTETQAKVTKFEQKDGKLVVTVDTIIPAKIPVTATLDGETADAVLSDGKTKTLTIKSDADASKRYALTALTAPHTSFETEDGFPILTAPAVDAAAVAALAKTITVEETHEASSDKTLDWEYEVSVTGVDGGEVAATTSGAGSGSTGTVGYWTGIGLVAPSGVTKLEFARRTPDEYHAQTTLDSFSSKKGFTTYINVAKDKDAVYYVKWQNAESETVSTNVYHLSFAGMKLKPVDVSAAISLDGTTLKVILDKAAPASAEITVTVDNGIGTKTFVSDGKATEFVLTESADAEQTYTLQSVEGELIHATISAVNTAAAAVIAAAPLKTVATTAAKKVTTTKKATSTKKTTSTATK